MKMPDPSIPSMWVPYVAVEDVDATVAKAQELGGSAVMDAMDVPNVGRIGVLKDPNGAVFGIIKPEPQQ
jgi:predicted enzyme related to lactoylglutathione lyase